MIQCNVLKTNKQTFMFIETLVGDKTSGLVKVLVPFSREQNGSCLYQVDKVNKQKVSLLKLQTNIESHLRLEMNPVLECLLVV